MIMNSSINMKRWLVAYTKPKHEKAVRDQMLKNNFEAYLPLIKAKKKWSDRRNWVDLPLFRSYVFVNIEPANSIYVAKLTGVVRIIRFGTRLAYLQKSDITTIKRMIEGGLNPRNENYFLRGNPVIVEEGPLKGVTGEVVKVKNQRRLLMRIDTLQQSISVNIDQGFLKLIN